MEQLGAGGPGGTFLGLQSRQLALILVSAVGYALATLGMKLASVSLTSMAILVICIGFLAAALAEISLLRHANLGVIYITIVAVETLLVLGIATLIGEGLDLRRIVGATLVVAGLALVSH
jgi:hypothetical protein